MPYSYAPGGNVVPDAAGARARAGPILPTFLSRGCPTRLVGHGACYRIPFPPPPREVYATAPKHCLRSIKGSALKVDYDLECTYARVLRRAQCKACILHQASYERESRKYRQAHENVGTVLEGVAHFLRYTLAELIGAESVLACSERIINCNGTTAGERNAETIEARRLKYHQRLIEKHSKKE